MLEARNWRIVAPNSVAEVDRTGLRLVATGRGLLRKLLGEADDRHRLFCDCIRWDRVLLIVSESGETGGFVTFKQQGRGPYTPALRTFQKVFGLWSGLWRFLAFWLLEARDLGNGFYIYGLKVSVHHRREGLARLLVAAVEQEAWRRGACHVTLEVGEENIPARTLYESLGYARYRTISLRGLSRFFPFSRLHRLRKLRPSTL
ncbi:MAG: GNAT family N-acetyltransferase [Candidatus Dactylopiibacterium carminicum]|uniref:N-acetyltransferase n=1 Tax=Candidatus Dactylopiibacterium carminicum TaxID=857335 RepID=A0A272ESR7_9RHOO|nr:GNAT family N-acetyltransferase [Candidatus Dactylopiibacterium carminicum]KAF7599112.1 N-acetyltransferase [Candidatus Dactylopiibacterium carminicum]PAS93127.1 MAG: GNAT family N-acetyltransferase [Candidatus Dactylopiibacterium carminicum]PAS96901.1 MAG: GNAT family N-acetyltransferase [Candidatus Dactylopiibacterium carminicum]PAS99125.1 MAG: hypothetical protein BSR46_09835 [Candidatus Dactylopiibacterium carminicum]